jgi:hypothetical protein
MKGRRDKGLILDPKEHSLEVFADADDSGNWKFDQSASDEATSKSRTGASCVAFQAANGDHLVKHGS